MKFLKTILVLALVMPSIALAQTPGGKNVVQGGTGLTVVPQNYTLVGNNALHLTALSPASLASLIQGSIITDWVQQFNFDTLMLTSSSSIPLWFQAGIFGSSTAQFDGSLTAANINTTSTATSTFLGPVSFGTDIDSNAAITVSLGSIWTKEYIIAPTSTEIYLDGATTTPYQSSNAVLLRTGTESVNVHLRNFFAGMTVTISVQNPESTAGAITYIDEDEGSTLIWPAGYTQTTTANTGDFVVFKSTGASTSPVIYGYTQPK